MHWFSLLFFSLFNVYELKYFVKYWKTGKPLRTTECVADALNRYTNYSDPGGTAGNSWWGCAAWFSKSRPYFKRKKVFFPHPVSGFTSKIYTCASCIFIRRYFLKLYLIGLF